MITICNEKEIKSFPKNEKGYYICPTGDYSQIKVFRYPCIFGDDCIFGCATFGTCIFGSGCWFDEGCVFWKNCIFGKRCRLGNDCLIAQGAVFGELSIFGNYCEFSFYCIFGKGCKFGKECKFKNYCKFEQECWFDEFCEFEIECIFKKNCYFKKLYNAGKDDKNNLEYLKINNNEIVINRYGVTNERIYFCKMFDELYIRVNENMTMNIKEFENEIKTFCKDNVTEIQDYEKLILKAKKILSIGKKIG